jgi:pyridinium-3,5-biscarboxylic acid mononucleotide sulfurtransferase
MSLQARGGALIWSAAIPPRRDRFSTGRHVCQFQSAVVPAQSKSGARSGGCRLDIHDIQWHFEGVSKLDQLRELLRSYGSCLVAYSGGVDSVFLARVAREVLGDKSLAVIADSASLPRRELEEALEIAERFQIPVRVVQTQEFQNPNYTANPSNRCYFCKHELFTELEPIAREEKFAVIAYGENASDVGDFRPGAQAAKEFQVRAPLKEVGMTKAEIREYSAQLGLPTADKPQMACLSSRIPHGEVVTPEKLRMIEAAENVLRDLGFYDVRVRHHELGGERAEFGGLIPDLRSFAPGLKHLARIEVGAAELPKLLSNGLSQRVAEALKEIGYAHVTLDLQGYRRGGADLRRPETAGVQR